MVDTVKSAVAHTADKLLHTVKMPTNSPITNIGLHLCALHAYAHDIQRQVVAHHYCSHYSGEMHQCVIYDSAEADARLIGIEYLISERLYLTLDSEERQLWHSHKYEVSSGMLIAPDLSETAETAAVQQIASMYGKICHTWQFDKHLGLPLGPPQLMMSVTADKYLNADVMKQHEQQNKYSAQQKKLARTQIEYHDILPGCDTWQYGEAHQYEAVLCNGGDKM